MPLTESTVTTEESRFSAMQQYKKHKKINKYLEIKKKVKFKSTKLKTRIRPTPPNFKRIPARIIEPNVGAST